MSAASMTSVNSVYEKTLESSWRRKQLAGDLTNNIQNRHVPRKQILYKLVRPTQWRRRDFASERVRRVCSRNQAEIAEILLYKRKGR